MSETRSLRPGRQEFSPVLCYRGGDTCAAQGNSSPGRNEKRLARQFIAGTNDRLKNGKSRRIISNQPFPWLREQNANPNLSGVALFLPEGDNDSGFQSRPGRKETSPAIHCRDQRPLKKGKSRRDGRRFPHQ